MTLTADPILILEKIGSFLIVRMIQIERIDCQPPIRVRAAAGKKSIDLVLCNEYLMIVPRKSLSCIKGNCLFCKPLKLCQHPIRIIITETHDGLIFRIRISKPFQPLHKVIDILRMRKVFRNPFCLFRISPGK